MKRLPIISNFLDDRFEINILSQNDEIERDSLPSFFENSFVPEIIVPNKEEFNQVYNFLKENINNEYVDPDHLASFDFEVQNQCQSERNEYRIDPEEYKVASKSKEFEFDEFYQIYVIAKSKFMITLILNPQNNRKYVLKHESEFMTSSYDLVKERMIHDEIKSFPNRRNISKFIELCLNSSGNYLVLEKGIIDLELFLKSYNDISLELFLFITNSILQAIKHIHDQNLANRDIKLQNFVFFKKGEEGIYLKMIDFGLAYTEFEEKRRNFQEDKILDLLETQRVLKAIGQKKIYGNSLKIEKWRDFLENIKNLEDVRDFFSFYKIFECKNKDIMNFSNKIFWEYFSENIILLGDLNISDEEKQFFSDNLCLFAEWFDGMKLNGILINQFIEREDWKKYIKTIENQLNLCATYYSHEFQNLKLDCFNITSRKIEHDAIDFIEKMNWNLQRIYQEVKSIQITRIRSSDKIYHKFSDLITDVALIKKYFEEIQNAYKDENIKNTKEANFVDSKAEVCELTDLQNKLAEMVNDSTTEKLMIKRTLILSDYDKKFKSTDICDFVSKGLSQEKVSFLKKEIGNIKERLNYKIKKKKKEARKKHHLIYNNFLQFLEIFLEENPMEQDFLRNKCRKGFKEIIQNKSFVVSHDFKEEFGKNTMIYI